LLVVSVTSEVLANASVQSASARSARPDPGPPAGNDSFGALIDSNAGQSDNRAQANPQDNPQGPSQAPAPRRADDSHGPSNSRSRDTTSASDNPPRNDADDRDPAVNARDGADAGTKADAPRGKSKSDTSKSSDTKSDDTEDAAAKSVGGNASSPDEAAKQDATAAVTADAIAVTIAVAVPTAPATSPATPATDKTAAPLAIAAAALAASAAVVNAAAPGAAGTGTTDAAAANASKADGTKTEAQTAAGEAVTAQATAADTTATAGIALAASTAAKTSAASKSPSQFKAAIINKEGATTPADGTADMSATATGSTATAAPAGAPQAAAGKPKAESAVIDAVKADASGNAAPAATAAAHGHAAATDAGQTLANTSANGVLGAGIIQAQQPSAVITPATAAQLTATVTTGDAIPLSGVAMEIAASAKSGKTSFEIRLDPADLGRIDVRIDVDRSGQVTSHLTVEKPETLSMLRQDAPQLQRALDDAGFKTDGSGLQFSLRDQSSSGQNSGNDTGRNAQRLVISEDDTMPATAIAGRSYGRMLGSSSGVDIRV
jgi:flagellar hook-length control protein FliK